MTRVTLPKQRRGVGRPPVATGVGAQDVLDGRSSEARSAEMLQSFRRVDERAVRLVRPQIRRSRDRSTQEFPKGCATRDAGVPGAKLGECGDHGAHPARSRPILPVP